jgi:hypothetical protein
MARLALPVVEVTAPDGSKSRCVACSVPHNEAVASVKESVPADHIAELSIRRVPAGLAFEAPELFGKRIAQSLTNLLPI